MRALLLLACLTACATPPRPPVALPPPGLSRASFVAPSGRAVPYVLLIPEQPAEPRALIVVLHHAGTITPYFAEPMVRRLIAPALAPLGAIIVAPDAQEDRDWGSPLNEATVVALTEAAIQSYGVDPRRVLLTGYSMGGRGTWSIGAQHQDLYSALIPMAAPPTPGPGSIRIPVCALQSRDDELIPLEPFLRSVEQLERRGLHLELRLIEGAHHQDLESFRAPLEALVPWVREAWER